MKMYIRRTDRVTDCDFKIQIARIRISLALKILFLT